MTAAETQSAPRSGSRCGSDYLSKTCPRFRDDSELGFEELKVRQSQMGFAMLAIKRGTRFCFMACGLHARVMMLSSF